MYLPLVGRMNPQGIVIPELNGAIKYCAMNVYGAVTSATDGGKWLYPPGIEPLITL
jgi:hypothetical protein